MRLMGPAINGVTQRPLPRRHRAAPGRRRRDRDQRDRHGQLPARRRGGRDARIWPLEALKAQAVAARTYALATRKTGGAFDQYPDTRSQVYRGVTGESVRSDAAVSDTAGPHPHLRRRAGGDLLLLHLRRAHRERGVLVPRLAAEAVAHGRAGPLRHIRPTTAGSCTFSAARLDARSARPGAFKRARCSSAASRRASCERG